MVCPPGKERVKGYYVKPHCRSIWGLSAVKKKQASKKSSRGRKKRGSVVSKANDKRKSAMSVLDQIKAADERKRNRWSSVIDTIVEREKKKVGGEKVTKQMNKVNQLLDDPRLSKMLPAVKKVSQKSTKKKAPNNKKKRRIKPVFVRAL